MTGEVEQEKRIRCSRLTTTPTTTIAAADMHPCIGCKMPGPMNVIPNDGPILVEIEDEQGGEEHHLDQAIATTTSRLAASCLSIKPYTGCLQELLLNVKTIDFHPWSSTSRGECVSSPGLIAW